jgi:hypothetical protein
VPTSEDLNHAIGCLSTVFPEFVAKELATLMDGIVSGVQGFSDPLSAAADLQLDSLIDNVAKISEGDVFDNLAGAAVGLTSQYVQRELSDTMATLSEEFPGVTKRVHEIRNLGEKVVTTGYLMMGLYADMPYVAAQKMCETIVKMADLKIANLECMRKHITQLVNAIIVLAKNVETYKDDTLTDLSEVSTHLKTALTELTNSQRISGTSIVFDSLAFDRARDALSEASRLLAPDKDGTSILDVADILTYGSVESAHVSRANMALSSIVIPSLIMLIEAEVAAAEQQSSIINHMISSMAQVVESFQSSANTSKIQQQRSRGINEIIKRITELQARVDLAIKRQSTRAASTEMLLWSSRVKSMMVVMDQIKELSFKEGSTEDVGKTAQLQAAFDDLLETLTNISSEDGATVNGIEDFSVLRLKVLALTKGAERTRNDIDAGRATPNRMATFHALAAQSASQQVASIEDSISVASQQKAACGPFLEIDIGATASFDQLVDSMRQLGLDRGVDLLNAGAFTEFLDSGMETLSYLGTVIKCLTDTINGLDDDQTKQQLSSIRDDLVAKQTNQNVAAADSSDQGISRYIEKLQTQISDIQKNAKTVEAILADLKALAKKLEINVDSASEGLEAFAGNLDKLAVGAGGRLASGLEEFSKHPKAGVPLCDAP